MLELIETSIFTRQVMAALGDDEYRALQLHLLVHPEAGSLIVGSGGLRKLRWRIGGRGKSGGIRIMYHWRPLAGQIYLLFLFHKNERSNLSSRELRVLRKLIADE